MRLAIVADWLPTFGGAEHVVAALHRLWPTAPIFTTIVNHRSLGPLSDAKIEASPLQTLYAVLGRHEYLLPLMPRAVEQYALREFDVVVSSSHAVGKGIIPPPSCMHVCYCHTPMRYAWEMEEQYLEDFRVRGLLKKFAKRRLKELRRWDLSTAKRVDQFIANSTETQKRIRRIYGRESIVIHPPVDEKFFAHPLSPAAGTPPARMTRSDGESQLRDNGYFLALGRFVPYKKFDFLIELANSLKIRLKIAGGGADEARLRRLAGSSVEFLGHVPDDALPELYSEAQAVLFPQHEDAGLVPLEAMACGTPVIAYAKGGVLDAIIDGVTGLLVKEQTVEAFAYALERSATIRWDPSLIRKHSNRFSHEPFAKQIEALIASARAGVLRAS